MSQFGFFNAPHPQPQPARPGYDAFPASHPAFDAPRRYDDPYARAPSPPPRAGYFESASSMGVYPSGQMLAQPSYPPSGPPHYADRPMAPMAPPSSYYPVPAAPQYRAPEPYEMRDPYPPSSSYPSSWRSEPPREERREFFGGGDTWRSAPLSPPRDRGYNYNTAAFAPRSYSPEYSRIIRDDRSPPRRQERSVRGPRYDERERREERRDERRSHDDRKRERSRSRDRKKEERKEEKTERERKSRERDSREPREKEKIENGEKKRRVDDKKEEIKEKEKKVIEPEVEETKDEPENKEEEIKEVGIIEEDEFEEVPEGEEEKEDNDRIEEEKEEKDEPKKIDVVKIKEENKKTDDRQSRIRSPSIEKKNRSPSIEKKDRSPSIEKKNRSHSTEKKKDDSGFKILADATFDEIHLPGRIPYGNFNKGSFNKGSFNNGNDARLNHEPSWAEQWKAKVMITKTAVHGLGGAPPVAASSLTSTSVAAAAYPPMATAPVPRPYADPYATARPVPVPYADERRPPSRGSAAYPPLAPREYAYGAPPSAYDMPPVARRDPPLHPNDMHRAEWPPRDEREMYARRMPDERMRSRSPPPPSLSRREIYDRREEYERYERRVEGREPLPVRDYYEERYRSERPEERGGYEDERARFVKRVVEKARYADIPDDRVRGYADRPTYEKPHAPPSERDRRSSHRERTPEMLRKKSPPIEEIDPSKLVEPLEDDGWDDVARLLSPEKVVVEKKAKKPLIAAAPPPKVALQPHHPPMQHRPIPRDPLPVPSPSVSSGLSFFSQPVPSTRPKIAFADSQPYYKNKTPEDAPHRPAFFPAPTERDGYLPAPAPVAPRIAPPTAEAYNRARSYEELASINAPATFRSGPAPGWERGGRGY